MINSMCISSPVYVMVRRRILLGAGILYNILFDTSANAAMYLNYPIFQSSWTYCIYDKNGVKLYSYQSDCGEFC